MHRSSSALKAANPGIPEAGIGHKRSAAIFIASIAPVLGVALGACAFRQVKDKGARCPVEEAIFLLPRFSYLPWIFVEQQPQFGPSRDACWFDFQCSFSAP